MLPPFWEIGAVGVEVVRGRPPPARSTVEHLVTVGDVGHAVNPDLVKGQDLGAATQGLGIALWEEMVYDGEQLTNPNLIEYRVPRLRDTPRRITPVLAERGDGAGPYGAKGAGEGALNPVPAAVAAAVGRAVGVWPTELPLTPPRVWSLLQQAAAVATGEPLSPPGGIHGLVVCRRGTVGVPRNLSVTPPEYSGWLCVVEPQFSYRDSQETASSSLLQQGQRRVQVLLGGLGHADQPVGVEHGPLEPVGAGSAQRGLLYHAGHRMGRKIVGTGPAQQLPALVAHQGRDLVEGHLVQRPVAQLPHHHRGTAGQAAAPAGPRRRCRTRRPPPGVSA